MTNTSHALDPHAHSTDTQSPHPAPSLGKLFGIWAGIGLQSFGGGASTTLLIQRAFIEKYGWVSSDEFLRLWNLCQLTPGINLIAIAILLGKRLGGARGIIVSLAGMLLPSATITCLLAAFFLRVEGVAAVQAALRGVIPATGGIMVVVAFNFARPFIRDARGAGLLYTTAIAAFVLVSAVALIVFNVPAILILPGLALVGALLLSPASPAPSPSANNALRDDQGDAQ